MDTHRDAHAAAVLSLVGAVIGTEVFPATVAGYRELLERAARLGTVRRAGVEGTGSFGAVLSRCLPAQGVDVFDVNRPDRTDRRRRGQSDPLDARNAARSVLSGRTRAQAKSGHGPVQMARMHNLAEVSGVKARTQDHYERRIKEGKTRNEVVRCLKRYVAREVFHLVRPTSSQPPL